MRLKHGDFLLDVLILACTSFGGPQVHFALFLDRLVKRRGYLSEEELFEIQALCSVLPGPTSFEKGRDFLGLFNYTLLDYARCFDYDYGSIWNDVFA
jgi:hypothetical protein